MSKTIPWSDLETQYLEGLADDLPFQVLVRSYQSKASHMGWPKRTERAIRERIYRVGRLSRVKAGELTTTGGAAEILGCPSCRVEAWLRKDRVLRVLKPIKRKGINYISRDSWRRLARELPEVLGGYPADRLFGLLEDRDLANAVARRFPRQRGDYRIRCVENGRVWRSCLAASSELHVSQQTISLAINTRGGWVPSLGLTFQAFRNGTPP